MTHKIALSLSLSLSLFAAVGLTACSVDAPTRDNFDYSFQEELPEGLATELGFAAAVEHANFRILFRDGLYGTENVDPKASSVFVTIDRILIESTTSHGSTWLTIRDTPIDLDLLELADGDVARLGGGPVPPGTYGAVVFQISEAWVEGSYGDKWAIDLPGSVLSLESDFTVASEGATTLTLDFGCLRSLEFDGDEWYAEPIVSFSVDGH